jgi:hypothetical protein
LFANNPGGARTWDEVEAAMHRLVLYHTVRDSKRSNSLSWRAARDAPRTRARAYASRCSTGAAAASALLRITCTGREWCPTNGLNNRLASADRGLAVGGVPHGAGMVWVLCQPRLNNRLASADRRHGA